ncbi:MAG TPA: LysE family translocator, partial [Aliiroseovarius sp.]|nr:LysE family translocator [Aliiroseovarius sp.]
METPLLTAFIGFAFVMSVTPGPNNLMLMASGANYGFARTIPHMLGISIGFIFMVVLVGLGLSQLFDAWPLTYTLLKSASIGYLTWLAWKIATAGQPKPGGASGRPFTFLQAAAFQWVNPKAWTMALTAISAYAPDNSTGSIILVALIFGATNLPSVSIWVIAGREIRRFLTSP